MHWFTVVCVLFVLFVKLLQWFLRGLQGTGVRKEKSAHIHGHVHKKKGGLAVAMAHSSYCMLLCDINCNPRTFLLSFFNQYFEASDISAKSWSRSLPRTNLGVFGV